MKKNIIFTFSFIFILFYSKVSVADNWLEKDLVSLPKETKIEIVKMYDDIHQNAYKLRSKIVETSNQLASDIENKVDKEKQQIIVDKLTNQIVDLSNDMRIAYTDLSNKSGGLSKKFEEEKLGDDNAEDFYNKLFTSDGIEDIYKLLDNSGIATPSKKQIMAKFGNEITTTQMNFNKAYNKYRGFWLAGITSGKDFENAKKSFATAVKNMINLSVNVYNFEVSKLNKNQIKQLSAERQKVTNKQLYKLKDKSNQVKLKTEYRLNSLK